MPAGLVRGLDARPALAAAGHSHGIVSLARKRDRIRIDDRGEIISIVRRVLSENLRVYTRQYILAAFLLVLMGLATALIPWMMKPLIDRIFYNEEYHLIPLICGAIAGVFVVRGFAGYGQAVIFARIGNNLVARYQKRLFAQLMRLGLDFYNDTRSAQLAARINANVLGVRGLLSITLKSIAGDAVLLIALVVVMIVQDPMLSLAGLLIGPPLYLAVDYLTKRMRAVSRQAVEINSRLVGALQESVQGIAIVKAFTMEDQLSAKLDRLITSSEERANKIAQVSERITPITEILAGLAVALVVAYAAYRSQATAEPPGSVIAFITALLLAYDPARRLAKVQVALEQALVNARMIYEILDLDPGQADDSRALRLDVKRGEVRFEDVGFSYAEAFPVLDKVSFVAEAGRTTAIVGPSGAGKSTIVALVQRFYDVDGGRILIDGQDIAGVTKASLRGAIAYVSQHPYLFEGSIRDNIRYGRPDATDAEIEEAGRLAHAAEFIAAAPQGYDTLLGENGITLSGGQRQRLSIARAIVRNAPILLLDEATSALDNESESRVQAALDEVMKGRTTIVIAHRLSTIVEADRIVVLEQGRVVEQGTHASLLRNPDGAYARLQKLYRGDGQTADEASLEEPVR
jgi:ATP-binding cassette, subfamily B, bacterial MsbA